ncbi:hypothetical protein [Mycobacterium intermedium]|uniref:hypothetical protein n=1 Tax=Mycobacterium intermedium TaxID=28445 RepID=UPI0021F2648A|nr:hypothetical protein [Mycobacterium intermedium]
MSSRNGVHHGVTVFQWCQFADPHTVAEALLLVPRDLEREPRFADAAYARQGHERGAVQCVDDPPQFVLMADENVGAP